MKKKNLKIVIISLLIMVIMPFTIINSYAYQINNEDSNINTTTESGIIEFNLETGEVIEKSFQEIENEILSIDVMNTETTEEIRYVEGYNPNENGVEPCVQVGSDNKTQVQSTTSFPYSAICALEITYADGCTTKATAFMIGPDLAATAGHCVYDYYSESGHAAHGLVSSIRVIPGKNGSSEPFGYAYASQVVYETTWASAGNTAEDWGLIKLNSTIGNSCGYMGFAYSDSYSGWPGKYVTVTGYASPSSRNWTQWTHREVVRTATDLYMTYAVDTEGGQSGSPVIEDGTGYAIAIHRGGDGTGYNMGVNITKSRFNTFLSYR